MEETQGGILQYHLLHLTVEVCLKRQKAPPKQNCNGSSRVAQGIVDPTGIYEESGLIPGLVQWVKDLVLP